MTTWPAIHPHTHPRWCWQCKNVAENVDRVPGQCPCCGRRYGLPTAAVQRHMYKLRERITVQEELVAEILMLRMHEDEGVAAWAKERLLQAEKRLAVLQAALEQLRRIPR